MTNESSIYRSSPGGPGRRVDLGALYAADNGRGPRYVPTVTGSVPFAPSL